MTVIHYVIKINYNLLQLANVEVFNNPWSPELTDATLATDFQAQSRGVKS